MVKELESSEYSVLQFFEIRVDDALQFKVFASWQLLFLSFQRQISAHGLLQIVTYVPLGKPAEGIFCPLMELY